MEMNPRSHPRPILTPVKVPTFMDPREFGTTEHQLDHAEQLIERLVEENESLRFELEQRQAS